MEPKSITDLDNFIRKCPAIDNHGHNLLRPDGLRSHPLLSITSEASDDAIEDAPKTLAHIRAAQQLRKLYDLPSDATWESIVKKRAELLDDKLLRRYFEGVQTILIDDGYEDEEKIEDYSWHDKFTMSPCKRILRIEEAASDILEDLHRQGKLPESTDDTATAECWQAFMSDFESAIVEAIKDPEVVGFKSVVCYLTGLDVSVEADGLESFQQAFLPTCVENEFEILAKGMNDAIVLSTCKMLAEHGAKPLQFHTGLGDKAMSLLRSNPAHLQPLIAEFPTVPIVLLHSSYPYTREAGYLASVYQHCYLDIGLVWPEISRDGQEQVMRQALELTPWSKLLWSTDGHYLPETYWLSSIQGRQAMSRVLCEYVKEGDLSISQATEAAKAMLFENSNRLYKLGLELKAEI